MSNVPTPPPTLLQRLFHLGTLPITVLTGILVKRSVPQAKQTAAAPTGAANEASVESAPTKR